ncbi:hypothetical protein JCM1841_003182 [Sporobolomyces salmonicolor]
MATTAPASDDDLPPLPPPLPPTHSRSFSSSSSSDAGSPNPPSSAAWSPPTAALRQADTQAGPVRSSVSGRGSGAGLIRSGSKTLVSRAGARGSVSSGSSSPSPTLPRSATLSRTLSTASSASARSTTHSPRSSAPATAQRASSSASHRSRASFLLAKVSPSLSPHGRFPSTSSTITSVGLRGSSTPEPLGLGIGGFARGLGQLPSPPRTASDGGSHAGGSRYGTVRSNGTEDSLATAQSGESGGHSPNKPERPPKSDARRSVTGTPPRRTRPGIPMIGRTSPTVAGSSDNTPARPTSTARLSRRISLASLGRAASPTPSSPLNSSKARTSLGSGTFSGEGEDSDASAVKMSDSASSSMTLREGLAGVEPRRRLRARTVSGGANELLGDESPEKRRERQSRRASELKEKNQRILDSINSHILPLVSPPPSQESTSNPDATDDDSPLYRTVTPQRSSTSSTIRDLAEGRRSVDPSSGLSLRHRSDSTWLEDNRDDPSRRTSLESTLRTSASVDEFGVNYGLNGSIRRSSTLGNLAEERELNTDRRARTAGYRSGGRSPLSGRMSSLSLRNRDDPLSERSMTSMSNYPSTADDGRAVRRSDLVGSERTRAASSIGDTRQRDNDFAVGMRRLASREFVRSPRDRSQSDATGLPDRPSALSTLSPSLRNRPGLPREFMQSPSTRPSTRPSSTLAGLDLEPTASPSTHDRLHSTRLTNPRTASPLSTTDPAADLLSREERRRYRRSDGLTSLDLDALPRERTPLRTKKISGGSGGSGSVGSGSVGRTHRSEGRKSISEIREDRPYSRLSREERRNGTRSPDNSLRGTATPPPPSSSRSEERYSTIAADLQARKERLRAAEVGSEAWIAEFEDLRRRNAHSRASNGSGDARSSLDDSPQTQSALDRDRTVRAINALLAGQGIVATAVEPFSPTASTTIHSSPRKRESFGGFDRSERNRHISFANGTNADSPLAPGSSTVSRSNSNTSRSGAESALRGYLDKAVYGDHHKLLLSAFDHFDKHFSMPSNGQADLPESLDLVRRMSALIASTTKLNNGLRALIEAIKDEQVQAQLDEGQRSPTISVSQFEKSVNALLRSSDDQVRTLTEDLIAFTRIEKERDRLRKDSESLSRPVSRASTYAGPLHSPPKRPATSSPFEGAAISLSSSRSPFLPREVLRNPLDEPADSLPPRRSTLHYAGRSPFAATDSPTPASRRDAANISSPLANETTFETPSRRSSIATTTSRNDRPVPTSALASTRIPPRRGKGSDSTARLPTPPSAVRFPTSSHPSEPVTGLVDSTPATSHISPTRPRQHRTYSEADRLALEALELAANVDEQGALDRPELGEASVLAAPAAEEEAGAAEDGHKKSRTRLLSTGSIGSALKHALTRNSRRGEPAAVPSLPSTPSAAAAGTTPRSSLEGGGSSPEERRIERRKEVEEILRRTTSRT